MKRDVYIYFWLSILITTNIYLLYFCTFNHIFEHLFVSVFILLWQYWSSIRVQIIELFKIP